MTKDRLVLLAAAPSADAEAEEAREALEALGYRVERLAARGRAGSDAGVKSAHRLLLLWTPDAANSPALRSAARRARTSGKLACVCVSREAPPPALVGARASALPRGRLRSEAWRRLMEVDMDAAVETSPARTDRYGAVLTIVLLAAVAATALYAVNPPFAAQLNGLAAKAQALYAHAAGG